MNVKQSVLIENLSKAAARVVSNTEAQYFAEETIETHIRKAPRTNPLKSAIEDIEACINHKDKTIEYSVDVPSFFSINFHGHGPLVYMKRIHDELEKRSAQNGLAMTAFTNGKGMHTLHAWVQGLAKRGLVAVAVCNGGPGAVVPLKGTKGVLGTNPIAYGIPGTNGEIFCTDMATSQIPYFEILNAHDNKTPLPEQSAVDNLGIGTTDADKALDFSVSKSDPTSNILPMGGSYKGYNIVYLMEILTSALIGMPSSPEMSTEFVAEEHGSLILVFNPKRMGSRDSFEKTIFNLNHAIASQTPKTGETIYIPGERNNKRFIEKKTQDIEIPDELFKKLTVLATL